MKELKARVEAKKHELQARIQEAKANAQQDRREQVKSLENKLAELHDHLRDGWESAQEETARKLNNWLAS